MPTERDLSKVRTTPDGHYDASQMDDFQVIAERRQIMTTLATLTDRYRELNQEIGKRETLQWMLAR